MFLFCQAQFKTQLFGVCVCVYVCVCVCACVRACVRACVCEREGDIHTQLQRERERESIFLYLLWNDVSKSYRIKHCTSKSQMRRKTVTFSSSCPSKTHLFTIMHKLCKRAGLLYAAIIPRPTSETKASSDTMREKGSSRTYVRTALKLQYYYRGPQTVTWLRPKTSTLGGPESPAHADRLQGKQHLRPPTPW